MAGHLLSQPRRPRYGMERLPFGPPHPRHCPPSPPPHSFGRKSRASRVPLGASRLRESLVLETGSSPPIEFTKDWRRLADMRFKPVPRQGVLSLLNYAVRTVATYAPGDYNNNEHLSILCYDIRQLPHGLQALINC